ncbi:sigma-54-dependent Fis family transcriptional regulator, partial [Fulvivirga sp. RKSG066]|uniref:helix-turn-helix domain-containing protein n=1 Tax=Fulvivirga aurantia TaxID=2529383 RepID=UPI0016240510
IRQLKNLTEQISVLSTEEKEIDAEKLMSYLPQDKNQLPALYKNKEGESGSGFSERDLLYKVLFDMKKDMNDLKKFVLDAIQNEGSQSEIIEDHSKLFEDIDTNDLKPSAESETPVLLNIQNREDKASYEEDSDDEPEIEDITHETEDESLSLEKKEKELIIKALKKNNNKRKYAAKDLGISERTLYRKIKQYELEEL